MNPRRIRVLIVDDSALVRAILTNSLARFPEIEVVGTANDPYVARDKILDLNPDLITLDIEMPRMDGITFLKVLMKHRPLPVIIVSSLTQAGSEKALEALQAGAVDVMGKPGGAFSAHEDGWLLAEKIRAAAVARIRPTRDDPPAQKQPLRQTQSSARPATHDGGRHFSPRKLILLGASTGGTEALKTVLTQMSGDLPGICIVQHIPAYFSKAFADRMNQICPMEVREAKPGDVVQRGLALIAPGGFHMLLRWTGAHYVVDLSEGPPIHHQRPAVDILFDSAVKCGAAPHAVAALLTGMGTDGATGLLHLREAGACTMAQSEESCVVFGMPREAIRLGAAQHIVPLDHIGPRLDHFVTLAAADAPGGAERSSR